MSTDTQRFQRITFSGDPTGSGVALDNSYESYIHRAGTDDSLMFEVWLYALNADTTDHTVTIYWATTGSESAGVFTMSGERGSTIIVNVPSQEGPVLIIPGFVLNGNGIELWISGTTDLSGPGMSVYGYINRIETEVTPGG